MLFWDGAGVEKIKVSIFGGVFFFFLSFFLSFFLAQRGILISSPSLTLKPWKTKMNMLSCFTVSIMHDKMFVISCYPLHFLLFILPTFFLSLVWRLWWCVCGARGEGGM